MEHEEKFILNKKEAEALYNLLGQMTGQDYTKITGGNKSKEIDTIFDLLFKRFNKL